MHKWRLNLNNNTYTPKPRNHLKNPLSENMSTRPGMYKVLLFKFRRHLCKGSIENVSRFEAKIDDTSIDVPFTSNLQTMSLVRLIWLCGQLSTRTIREDSAQNWSFFHEGGRV